MSRDGHALLLSFNSSGVTGEPSSVTTSHSVIYPERRWRRHVCMSTLRGVKAMALVVVVGGSGIVRRRRVSRWWDQARSDGTRLHPGFPGETGSSSWRMFFRWRSRNIRSEGAFREGPCPGSDGPVGGDIKGTWRSLIPAEHTETRKRVMDDPSIQAQS